MGTFEPHVVSLRGRLLLDGEVDKVFPLFSPSGEKLWVPEWEPELIYPNNIEWACGQIFRTNETMGEAVWIVTRLDHESYAVEYHRVESGRCVARIEVVCRSTGHNKTEATISYSFVGLSEAGNREIDAMTQRDYDAKMSRWTRWINDYLETGNENSEV